MTIEDFGFIPALYPPINPPLEPARITAVHKNRYELFSSQGFGFGQLKPSVYYHGNELFPTVGDFVLIHHQPLGDSYIEKTLPRTTYFSRLDPSSAGHSEQAVAANFDYALILQSFNQDFNPRRLERYLTLAWQSGALPLVILTKADLTPDPGPYLAKAQALAGIVQVIPLSLVTGEGTGQLAAYLSPGKTAVLLGSSGVGKSSLTNFLMGEKVMDVNTIRFDDGKGRHTTTHRQLVMLPAKAMVIDTPGMRELGMWDITRGAEQSFEDIYTLARGCRFSDCSHQAEPGCAIAAALQDGRLAKERWAHYLRLEKEAKYTAGKAQYLKAKWQRNKEIAQFGKKLNKERKG